MRASGALQTFDCEKFLCRYYGANAPVYQVDILDTNTMTFHGGERSYHLYLLPLLTVCFSLSGHTRATAADALLQSSLYAGSIDRLMFHCRGAGYCATPVSWRGHPDSFGRHLDWRHKPSGARLCSM